MKKVKITLFGFLVFLASCTGNKNVELQYAKENVESANYELNYFQDSKAYMNDEPMTAQYKVNLPMKLKSSQKGTIVKSDIYIPKMDVKIVLPTGQQTLDTRNLKDINLDFAYTANGNRKKITQDDRSMVIDFGEMLGGKLEWEFLFKYATPNLPDRSVKIGDTWSDSLSLPRIEAGSKIEADLFLTHKLTGFEKLKGRECAVIESEINSVLDDTFELMAMPWDLKGELFGDMIWYFDYNQGVIVKLKIEEQSEGVVESEDEEMSATYTQSSVIELNLIH
jgi:hypothetical protein